MSTENFSDTDLPFMDITTDSPEPSTSRSGIGLKLSSSGKIKYVRRLDDLKCVICGDRPTGYHYDVLSCNGCKTFYRRTLINKRKYSCSRGGKCEFSKDFRCACRACRFKKCINAGMKPDMIQYPTKKEEEQEEETSVSPMQRSPLDPEHLAEISIIHEIIQKEIAVESYRTREALYYEYLDRPLEELMTMECSLGTQKKHEKNVAPCEKYQKEKMKFWTVTDLYLIVEFAKSFSEFRELSKQDQIEIMSCIGGAMQVFCQSYYSLQYNSEGVVFPDGTDALYERVIKRKYEYEHHYRDCYCRPVDIVRQLKMTSQEFAIFKTITLFKGNTSQLAQEIVRKKREELLTIFRKYLIKQYGIQVGLGKLAACLVTIKTLIDISEKRRSYLFIVDLMHRKNFPQLVRGIYLRQ